MKRVLEAAKKRATAITMSAVIVGSTTAMILWPKGPKSLASVSSLSEASGPEKTPGCFTIKNTSTNEIVISISGVDTWFAGEWSPHRDYTTNAHRPVNLLPGKTTVLRFNPPSSSTKWRGRIYLHQPPEGLQYWAARGRFIWKEVMAGFPNGTAWDNGVAFTTPVVVTREITP